MARLPTPTSPTAAAHVSSPAANGAPHRLWVDLHRDQRAARPREQEHREARAAGDAKRDPADDEPDAEDLEELVDGGLDLVLGPAFGQRIDRLDAERLALFLDTLHM